jgi:hypothetical protein
MESLDRDPLVDEQPGGAHQRMPGELEFELGGEDSHLAALAIVDEDGLGVAEFGGDGLTLRLGHLGAMEEDAELVAAAAVRGAEHAQHVEGGHGRQL